MEQQLIQFIRDIYASNGPIPLHAPILGEREKTWLSKTIDSTFVSSIGSEVDLLEQQIANFAGSNYAIATVNGTAALHTALYLADIRANDLVLTQALTFVATCNTIHHLGAKPVFIDIESTSYSLCPQAVEHWLSENAFQDDQGQTRHKASQAPIKALLPMHTFGHPAQLDELAAIAQRWNLVLIEDAAESLGSWYKGRHTGTIGRFGALSFNGNKIITTGGGGMILCQRPEDAQAAKHTTTTAKRPHLWEFFHDQPGFNYRMPNLNAALGCAQMERLEPILENKRSLAARYQSFFADTDYRYIQEPPWAQSNYWLNTISCPDRSSRDRLLETTNRQGIMTRPVWQLMHRLPMYNDCLRGDLSTSEAAEERLLNLPSTPLLLP